MDKSAIPGALTTFSFPFLSLAPYEDVAMIPPKFTSQFVHGLFPDFCQVTIHQQVVWCPFHVQVWELLCPYFSNFKYPLSSNFSCQKNHSWSHSPSQFQLVQITWQYLWFFILITHTLALFKYIVLQISLILLTNSNYFLNFFFIYFGGYFFFSLTSFFVKMKGQNNIQSLIHNAIIFRLPSWKYKYTIL